MPTSITDTLLHATCCAMLCYVFVICYTMIQAIQKGFKIDFTAHPVVCAPPSIGNKLLDNYALEDVLDYIDWNPFFQVAINIPLYFL
jgi:hypothetical protein